MINSQTAECIDGCFQEAKPHDVNGLFYTNLLPMPPTTTSNQPSKNPFCGAVCSAWCANNLCVTANSAAGPKSMALELPTRFPNAADAAWPASRAAAGPGDGVLETAAGMSRASSRADTRSETAPVISSKAEVVTVPWPQKPGGQKDA